MSPGTYAGPRPYFTCALQRPAILERLRASPATRRELESLPGVCDATARIHELRNEGHNIETQTTPEANPDGSYNMVGVYVLHEGPSPQGTLFEPTPSEGDPAPGAEIEGATA